MRLARVLADTHISIKIVLFPRFTPKNLQNIPTYVVVLQKDEALLVYILDKQKEKSIVLMADKSITATIKAAEGLKHFLKPQ